MTLLAAFYVLLARYSGQDDLARGRADRRTHSPGAGRPHRILREHAGASRGPVRCAELHGVSRRVFAHARSTLTRIRTCRSRSSSSSSRRGARLRGNPLFQVSFVLQNTPPGDWRAPGVRAEQMDVASEQPSSTWRSRYANATESSSAASVTRETCSTRRRSSAWRAIS